MTSDWLYWLGGGLLGAIGIALAAWALFADRSRGRRRCPKCWYDMSGTAPGGLRCPECGREAKREKKLFNTRRRWKWALAAIVPLVTAAFLSLQPKVKHDGWASIVPTVILISALKMPDPAWAFDELDSRMANLSESQYRMLRDVCLSQYDPMGQTPFQTRHEFIEHCARADDALLFNDDDEASVLPSLAARARQDPEPKLRLRVLYYLGLHSNSDEVVSPMLDYLRDADDDVRHYAILVLSFPAGDPERKSERAMDELVSQLGSDDSRARGFAGRAIGIAAKERDDSAELCDLLVKAFDHESDIEARCELFKGLMEVSCDAEMIRPVIVKALESDAIPLLRETFFLLYLVEQPELHPVAISAVVTSLGGEDAELRNNACLFLRRIDPSLLVPFASELEALRNSSDHFVADSVSKKLRAIQDSTPLPRNVGPEAPAD